MKYKVDDAIAWGVELGYHDVFGTWHETDVRARDAIIDELSAGSHQASSFARPTAVSRAFQGSRERAWGIAIQLYSVRSATNWGIGDFGDLKRVVAVAAKSGASAIGLNPLHALRGDRLDNPSPYAPDSRLFLNWLYVDIDQVPELDAGEKRKFEARASAFRESALVDYSRIANLKAEALQLAFTNFLERADGRRQERFAEFCASAGEALKRYSSFQVLRQRYSGSWREWPKPWRHPSSADLETFRAEQKEYVAFHEYVQWLASEQLRECQEFAKQEGLSIGLYMDLAVGVDPDGADAWSFQESIVPRLSIGAPPDEYNPGGQNWGVAPLNPHSISDGNYKLFRMLLNAAMQYAGAVRLDHVAGLMRLYVVPSGAGGGAYIRYPFEALLNVISEESERNSCIFIGEDLGTVPEGFRETAERWGLWSYRVLLFERAADGTFLTPGEYPKQALATFSTHDLPTYRGWVEKYDLKLKKDLGIDPGETLEDRERSIQALRTALGGLGYVAVCKYLGATPSRLVMVSAEDLFGVRDQVNIPSTVGEHANWRQKIPVPVEEWASYGQIAEIAATFRTFGR